MKNKLTRRDFLSGLVGKKSYKEKLSQKTGLDQLSRQADHAIANYQYRQAMEYLQKLTAKSPDHVQAKRKLGYCYQQIEDLDNAIQEFKTVLQMRMKDNFALLYLGLCLCKKGQIHEAFYYWKKYFNIHQPIIQRRLNLYIGYYEKNIELSGPEIVAEIEEAISEQRKSDVKDA